MAESPEHQFLAQIFNDELQAFSKLDLYTTAETARRQFDFASTITRSWSRVLVGQTLWRHNAGIEKDVRSLLFEQEADVKAYLVRDDAAVAGRVATVLDEFRTSGRVDDQLFRLVRFAVPVFDADKEHERAFVAQRLREQLVENLLFRVLFGHITARDVHYLLHWDTWRSLKSLEGHRALALRLLHYLATPPSHFFIRTAADDLGSNERQVRTALDHLRAAEMVMSVDYDYRVTDKGRFFLDLIARLAEESRQGCLSAELRFLCGRLGLDLDQPLGSAEAKGRDDRLPPIAILLVMLFLARADIPEWDLGAGEWLASPADRDWAATTNEAIGTRD